MTDREWKATALLLERGFKWKDPFAAAHERAYRALLSGYSADAVAGALGQLVARGQVFGPAPGEIVQIIEADPGRPTFLEAFSAIFDSRGALAVRGPGGPFDNEAAMLRARDDAALERAWEIHPLVGAFVESYGTGRLRMLQLDDPEHGGVVRRDLEGAWDRFVEANRQRDAAALAAGRRRELSRSPRQLDPLASLGIKNGGE